MGTPFSAAVRPDPAVDIAKWLSSHKPAIQHPPGHTGRTPDVLPFGRDHIFVHVLAKDSHVAARVLEEAPGPYGTIIAGPAPLQAVVPVATPVVA